MSEFANLISEAIGEMKNSGLWLESGTINLNGVLYSYRIQQLKQKPQKPCKECGLFFTSDKFDICYNCRPKRGKSN